MTPDNENITVGKLTYSGPTSDYYARTSVRGAQDPRYQRAKAAEDALKVQKSYDTYSRNVTLRNTPGSDIGTLNSLRAQQGLSALQASQVKIATPITTHTTSGSSINVPITTTGLTKFDYTKLIIPSLILGGVILLLRN